MVFRTNRRASPGSNWHIDKIDIGKETAMTHCPCGSEKKFTDCCEPFINGEKTPATAEELLRSRYSAFTISNVAYIVNTTSPNQRNQMSEDAIKKWADDSEWKKLEIIDIKNGSADAQETQIEFIAHYVLKDMKQHHHEIATFKKYDGKWLFEDGKTVSHEQFKRETPKVGRNDPCSCGSGKKYKKCCGR